MIDFAPLSIRRSTRQTDHITRYRVEQAGKPPVIVEAASAAEALKKSGVREATRIVNLDVERLNMLASGVLLPEESTVSTNIALDEDVLPQFFQADLSAQAETDVAFEEMSVGTLAEMLSRPAEKPFAPAAMAHASSGVAATPSTMESQHRQEMATMAVPPAGLPSMDETPADATGAPGDDSAAPSAVAGNKPTDVFVIGGTPAAPVEPQKELTPEEIRRLLSSQEGES
jgi:hypothetical protein